jgi:hypothetical protein
VRIKLMDCVVGVMRFLNGRLLSSPPQQASSLITNSNALLDGANVPTELLMSG